MLAWQLWDQDQYCQGTLLLSGPVHGLALKLISEIRRHQFFAFHTFNFNKRESISGWPPLISPTSPKESTDILVTNGKPSPSRADIDNSDETV